MPVECSYPRNCFQWSWLLITLGFIFSVGWYYSSWINQAQSHYYCYVLDSQIKLGFDEQYHVEWTVNTWRECCSRGHGCGFKCHEKNDLSIWSIGYSNQSELQRVQNQYPINATVDCYRREGNSFSFYDPTTANRYCAIQWMIITASLFTICGLICLGQKCYHQREKIREVSQDVYESNFVKAIV